MSITHDRIIEIAKKLHLAHVGSCLTAVNIIEEIYQIKKKDEKFILSCGHAGLALYVIIEKYEGINAEDIYKHHGAQPGRCDKCRLDCSTGSLGHGLPIALGMAMANRTKNVYCLISDGECSEGTMWEVSNVVRKYNVSNLKIYLNFNGWSAYDRVDERMLGNIMTIFPSIHVRRTRVEDYGLSGLSAHYIRL
jgi:transketolase